MRIISSDSVYFFLPFRRLLLNLVSSSNVFHFSISCLLNGASSCDLRLVASPRVREDVCCGVRQTWRSTVSLFQGILVSVMVLVQSEQLYRHGGTSRAGYQEVEIEGSVCGYEMWTPDLEMLQRNKSACPVDVHSTNCSVISF